jgi:BlaI family transcriptional regulator, penicillinase repressor
MNDRSRPLPPTALPSNLEMTILSLLWTHNRMTARQVLEQIPDQKKRAYTSVLSVLQVMEKKGLVAHDSQGQVNWYHARITRRRVLGPMLRQLVRNLFGGSPAAAAQTLLDETSVSASDLQEIDAFVQNLKKSKGTRS